MTRISTPQLAARFLGAEEVPAALRQQRSSPAYREALDALLPLDLLTATHLMRVDGDVVWLRADSPAVATRLRQIQVRLRRGFVERGLVAAAIKVKVGSPHLSRREPPPRQRRVLPDAARSAMSRVAERLPAGPLRERMLRLARSSAPA
ncbi:MAG: DciA family protein [Burkholderiales bacterium]|nr:DciA family protein [Burkholderiales bacterium]